MSFALNLPVGQNEQFKGIRLNSGKAVIDSFGVKNQVNPSKMKCILLCCQTC